MRDLYANEDFMNCDVAHEGRRRYSTAHRCALTSACCKCVPRMETYFHKYLMTTGGAACLHACKSVTAQLVTGSRRSARRLLT